MRTAKNQPCGQPCKRQERMRAHLAPRSDHRLGGDNNPPLTLECVYKPHFFRRVIILIETTRRLEGAASAKQAGSAREKVQPAAQTFSNWQSQSPPPRQPPL